MKRELDKSDIATILAALRLFQETYENEDADEIYADWEEHFTDDNGEKIVALSTDDINTLCEEINCDKVVLTNTLPIVVVEGGCVSEVLNVNGYAEFDWDNFKDDPGNYWFDMLPEHRRAIREAFDPRVLRQIEELIAAEMAYFIKEQRTDPFWMVPAR